MANSRTSNTIKNSTSSLVYKLVHMMIQFIIRTVFIHVLGNEYTGISGLFTDILQVLSMMELGLDSSLVYALYKPLAQKDENKISALLSFYRRAFNIIGVVVLIAGGACTPFLDYIVKGVPNISEDIRGIFLIYVSTSAFSYFLIYKTVLLRADQKSRVISNYSSMIGLAECAVEVVLLLVFKKFYAYLITHFIATILRNFILSAITTKRYSNYFAKNATQLSKTEKRILYRDLACLTVYHLSGVVINSTDSVFISAFIGTVEVAIIGNFTLIISSVRTAVSQIVNATKPSIGNLAATSSDNKQEMVFNRMNFISFWISCFSCTCLMVLLNPFIGDIWFDASYKVSELIIAVLVVNFFIAVMVFPVESFRTANGLFVQGWYRPAIMAVLNIALDMYMGQKWGIIGIFLATTISRALTQVWYDPYLIYKHVFKKSPKKYFIKYILYFIIALLSCFVAVFLCNSVQIANKYIHFLCSMIIAIIIPNLFVILLFHKSEEFSYLMTLPKKLLQRLFGKKA